MIVDVSECCWQRLDDPNAFTGGAKAQSTFPVDVLGPAEVRLGAIEEKR